MNHSFHIALHWFSADRFYNQKNKASAVQSRERDQVHDAQVRRQKNCHIQRRHDFHYNTVRFCRINGLSNGIHNTHRTGQVTESILTCEQHAKAVDHHLDPIFHFQRAVLQNSERRLIFPQAVAEIQAGICAHLRDQHCLMFISVVQIRHCHRISAQRILLQIFHQRFPAVDIRAIDPRHHISRLNTCLFHGKPFFHRNNQSAIRIFIIAETKAVLCCDRRNIHNLSVFSVPLHRQTYLIRRNSMHGNRGAQFLSKRNVSPIVGGDHIPRFQTGFRFRRAFRHFHYPRRSAARIADHNNRQKECKNQIEHRSCRDHRHPCPDRFTVEGSLSAFLLIFSQHCAGAAERQQFQRIRSLPPGCLQKYRPHTDRKLCHGDMVCFRQQKMSQLMKNNDQAEDQNGDDNNHSLLQIS